MKRIGAFPGATSSAAPGKMFFKDCPWFGIPSRKIHFYVPKHIGDKLLVEAGRMIPLGV